MGNRQCDAPAAMSAPLMLLALVFATAVAAPAQFYEDSSQEVVIPQKRAALVLDRILIALQKALHEDPRTEVDSGPRASPLRLSNFDTADMSALQRRGQAGTSGRGRVLRCYFNAVTCF